VDKVKTVALASMVACIVLAASIVGVYMSLNSSIQQQSEVIKTQGDQIEAYRTVTDEMNDQINALQFKVNEYGVIINYQTAQIANLTRDMDYFRLPD
jgi:uncharacterized protein YoxC